MNKAAVQQSVLDVTFIDPANAQSLGDLPPEQREYWRRRLMVVIARELGITESEGRHRIYRHLFGKETMWGLSIAEALVLVNAANAFPNDLKFISTQEEIVDV